MKQMKLWMVAAAMLCGTTICAQAQENKHEIGVSYGAGCNSTLFSFLEDFTALSSTMGTVQYANAKEFGTLSVEYFYHPSAKVGFGAIAAYAQTKKEIFVTQNKVGDAKMNYITVMPAVKLDWFQKEYYGMYSKLAAGVTFRSEKQDCQGADKVSETDVMFNWQASLVGIEAGSANFRAFAELGFGEQGIILAGLRYKF